MKNKEHIYFLGIGGIGMSALARYFHTLGHRVSGYDRTPSALTRELEAEGIDITYDEARDNTLALSPSDTLVVRTPAVPENEAIYAGLRARGFRILKRSEILGLVTRNKKALCVAGTHGKTTTSTLLAHLMQGSHLGTSAFLGGISQNYHSNLLINHLSDYVVVEADEYDRSFHHLTPYMSVITSIDPDHLDIYGTGEAYQEGFDTYARLVQDTVLLRYGYSLHDCPACLYTYSGVLNETPLTDHRLPDFYADQVRIEEGCILYDFHTPHTTLHDMQLGVPVWVNIENSVAAMAIAWLNGVTEDELRRGLASFAGVWRRFNVLYQSPRLSYIDDYAHHPTELEAAIRSIRRLYPKRHVMAVFQPHLYTRTRDFAKGFARVLSSVDELVLLPIYPARELPIEGVSSDALADLCNAQRPECHAGVVGRDELVDYLRYRLQADHRPVALLTLGAGDIDRLVEPITHMAQTIQ